MHVLVMVEGMRGLVEVVEVEVVLAVEVEVPDTELEVELADWVVEEVEVAEEVVEEESSPATKLAPKPMVRIKNFPIIFVLWNDCFP